MSLSRRPYIIRHTLEVGVDFKGELPQESPKRDGIVYEYINRTKGGRMNFGRLPVRLNSLMLRFHDSTSWKIGIHHKQAKTSDEVSSNDDSLNPMTIIATDGDAINSDDGTMISVYVDFIISPDDSVIFITEGATNYPLFAEATAFPIGI